MTEPSEAAKVAEEILEELHPWIKEWDYHYLQGRIPYVASVIQRLLDKRNAEIERMKQRLDLAEAAIQAININTESSHSFNGPQAKFVLDNIRNVFIAYKNKKQLAEGANQVEGGD